MNKNDQTQKTKVTLCLAPMATLSHEALRLLIHQFSSPDEYFTEMIHAPSLLQGGPYEAFYLRTSPVPERLVWQLTASSQEPLVQASRLLRDLGGIGIDINMGCSAPNIAKYGSGIAWMSKALSEVASLVRAVRKEVPGRLSVKCRLGEDENYERLIQFCRLLVDEGVDLITLHPRTRKQSYSRPAKHNYVQKLVQDLKIPIYANGDISTSDKARMVLDTTEAQGLMLGRIAIQKPWIFARIQHDLANLPIPSSVFFAPETKTDHIKIDHRAVAQFFLESLQSSQPKDFYISRAHRFFFYYCDNLPFAHHIKMRIQQTKHIDQILPLLDQHFAEVEGSQFSVF